MGIVFASLYKIQNASDIKVLLFDADVVYNAFIQTPLIKKYFKIVERDEILKIYPANAKSIAFKISTPINMKLIVDHISNEIFKKHFDSTYLIYLMANLNFNIETTEYMINEFGFDLLQHFTIKNLKHIFEYKGHRKIFYEINHPDKMFEIILKYIPIIHIIPLFCQLDKRERDMFEIYIVNCNSLCNDICFYCAMNIKNKDVIHFLSLFSKQFHERIYSTLLLIKQMNAKVLPSLSLNITVLHLCCPYINASSYPSKNIKNINKIILPFLSLY